VTCPLSADITRYAEVRLTDNAGGAKAPDWCAFEDGELKVIGAELTTPEKIRILSEKAVFKSPLPRGANLESVFGTIGRATQQDVMRRLGRFALTVDSVVLLWLLLYNGV
jgi:hypothetical protein